MYLLKLIKSTVTGRTYKVKMRISLFGVLAQQRTRISTICSSTTYRNWPTVTSHKSQRTLNFTDIDTLNIQRTINDITELWQLENSTKCTQNANKFVLQDLPNTFPCLIRLVTLEWDSINDKHQDSSGMRALQTFKVNTESLIENAQKKNTDSVFFAQKKIKAISFWFWSRYYGQLLHMHVLL